MPVPSTILSHGQLSEFADSGYLVVEDVVSEGFLTAADAEIDRIAAADPPPKDKVGMHSWFLPPSEMPAADAALRNSGAIGVAEQLVHPSLLEHRFDHLQLALNIPPHRHTPGAPNIDCSQPHQNQPDSFTMLAGIYLGDESLPNTGNLWVWPGSHRTHASLFREHGLNALLAPAGHASEVIPLEELGTGEPILAKRGDLLLAHMLLGHNIGGNTSDQTRRILYYRLSCSDHMSAWRTTLTDSLFEYGPVRKAVGVST